MYDHFTRSAPQLSCSNCPPPHPRPWWPDSLTKWTRSGNNSTGISSSSNNSNSIHRDAPLHSYRHLRTDDSLGSHPTGTPTPPLHSFFYAIPASTHSVAIAQPTFPTTSTTTTSDSRSNYLHPMPLLSSTVPLIRPHLPHQARSHFHNRRFKIPGTLPTCAGTPMLYMATNFTATSNLHNGLAVQASLDFPLSMSFHGFLPTMAQPITQPGH